LAFACMFASCAIFVCDAGSPPSDIQRDSVTIVITSLKSGSDVAQ
jgi:hypothetical protein